MVASDTVVGIVGAVLLVGVMVGVFVYEYNNVDSVEGTVDGFEAAYPTLSPTGDIDGDGTLNQDDDDLDGDGIPNGEDNATAVGFSSTATVNSDPGPGQEATAAQGFFAGIGNQQTEIQVTWTSQGSGAIRQPNLGVRVVIGENTTEVPIEYSGNAASAVLTLGPLDRGTYRVVAYSNDGSLLPTQVNFDVTVSY